MCFSVMDHFLADTNLCLIVLSSKALRSSLCTELAKTLLLLGSNVCNEIALCRCSVKKHYPLLCVQIFILIS